MHLEIILSLPSFDRVGTVAMLEIDINAMEKDRLQLWRLTRYIQEIAYPG